MSKRHTGRCACGAVTYGFDDPPSFVANCHCTDCKRASGGEMATFGLVAGSDFTVSGETTGFPYPANTETCAGNGLTRVFCVACGSRVYTADLADFPGGVFVQEGTLDNLDGWFAPQAEIYTWSRQPWMPALDVPQYDHGVVAAAVSGEVRN
ncbi:GFA family protein [Actinoplanes sp. N902-109]|uniref:GFA family protein n=1 Tax=Actinoplanes sp. (strain N902-109) TaxID=649831 RepID=UPI0005A216E5|nr:GFA family protein [Actinoplanes sp. N902-109]